MQFFYQSNTVLIPNCVHFVFPALNKTEKIGGKPAFFETKPLKKLFKGEGDPKRQLFPVKIPLALFAQSKAKS